MDKDSQEHLQPQISKTSDDTTSQPRQSTILSMEEVISVPDYMKAVKAGRKPKGANHENIVELSKMPDAAQTQVIVLTFSEDKAKKPMQHRST